MKRADDAIVVDADLATPDEIVKSIIEKLTPVAGTLT
jgi:cytidylate kinase